MLLLSSLGFFMSAFALSSLDFNISDDHRCVIQSSFEISNGIEQVYYPALQSVRGYGI